jgi:hypothetical protein
MVAVCYSKESQFHNGTGPIFELAVSNNKLHVCAVSLSKISLYEIARVGITPFRINCSPPLLC